MPRSAPRPQGQPSPAPGFESPETFANTMGFGPFIRRLVPMLVLILLIGWLLAWMVLKAIGLGGLSTVLALVVALALCGLMVVAKRQQMQRTWSASALELSPAGVTQHERYLRIHVPWSGLRSIGPVTDMAALRVDLTPNGAVRAITGAASESMRRTQDGLLGAGTVTVSDEAPGWFREQVRQNRQEEHRQLDEQTGEPLRGIGLATFDPRWRTGRIGQWISAYRPDLLADGS